MNDSPKLGTVSGNVDFPEWILQEIVTWMARAKRSRLTINIQERTVASEPIRVTLEDSGFSRVLVERHARTSVLD